jgi:hypothetical protein
MTHADGTPVTEGKFALPSSVYDIAKDFTQIYLPATAVLYVALASIWGWGFQVEVAGTIAAIVTFLGVVLKISTASYNKSDKSNDGVLIIDKSDPLKDQYLFDVSTPLNDVENRNTITLRVDPNGLPFDPSSQH